VSEAEARSRHPERSEGSQLLGFDNRHFSGGAMRPHLHHSLRVIITGQKEGSELRFEVNGQMFFVNFVPEEGRWYCFAPTATGVQRIPVSIDASPFEAFTVAVDEQAKEVVN
jgi:hypothetical protein